jgi:hypothetical protein
MTDPRDERPQQGGAEEELVERLASVYAPAPMTAAERVAFDEAIRARIERPERRPMRIPIIGAAAATAAAALVWFVLTESGGPIGSPGGEESGVAVAVSWEDELFLSSDLGASEDRDESEILPDDYLAIASVFVDG